MPGRPSGQLGVLGTRGRLFWDTEDSFGPVNDTVPWGRGGQRKKERGIEAEADEDGDEGVQWNVGVGLIAGLGIRSESADLRDGFEQGWA